MGKINGVVETHYGNGQLESRANYKNGNLGGLYETWYDNGQPSSRETYKDGVVVEYPYNNTKIMGTFKKINLKCEAQGDFAKDTCEWIKEMRTKYAGITDNEKMILEIVEEHLERIAKMYSKKEAENENN